MSVEKRDNLFAPRKLGKKGNEGKQGSMKSCEGRKKTLSRRVVMTLQDAPESNINAKSINVYQKAFATAYNKLRKSSFRGKNKNQYPSIVKARVITDGKSSPSTSLTTRDFDIPFNITFNCECCNSSNTLFRSSVSLRRLVGEDLAHVDNYTAALTDGVSTPRQLQQELFTAESFTIGYNTALRKLNKPLKTAIIPAFKWTELEAVGCSNDVGAFEASYFITIDGDVKDVSSAGLTTFAQGFLQVLNSFYVLNDDTCDPLFRVIVSASAEVVDTNAPPNGRNLAAKFTAKVTVRFQCRGCSKNTKLLKNDASRRRRLESPHNMAESARGLAITAASSDCYCVVGADNPEPPTTVEFDDAFKRKIAELKTRGTELDFITSVGNVTEILPLAPSITPSQSSDAPSTIASARPSQSSDAPSTIASARPSQSSDAPSTIASARPSQSSDAPSTTPSIRPSQSSAAPSATPSIRPTDGVEVECSPDIRNATTRLIVMACANDNLSLGFADHQLVSSLIKESLKGLFDTLCVRDYRSITEVFFLDSFDGDSCQSETLLYDVYYQNCYKCTSDYTKLLSDVVSVDVPPWSSRTVEDSGNRHLLTFIESCYCDIDARLPNVNELFAVLQSKLQMAATNSSTYTLYGIEENTPNIDS